MTTGFDVCLHNKHLNMLVVNNKNGPDKDTTEEPNKIKPAAVQNYRVSIMAICSSYYKSALVVAHAVLLCAHLYPLELGAMVHYTALIMTPCVSILNPHVVYQVQALVLHLAAVYAITFDDSQVSISLSMYAAALIVLAIQAYFKKRHSICQTYITVAAAAGVMSTIAMQQIPGFEHLHVALDVSALCIMILVFICNEVL